MIYGTAGCKLFPLALIYWIYTDGRKEEQINIEF